MRKIGGGTDEGDGEGARERGSVEKIAKIRVKIVWIIFFNEEKI